jgi:dTDP-4-dehydrorhamnose reductase
MKMKILLTGKNGQVGADLTQLLPRLGEVIAFDSQQLNLTKLEEVRRAIRRIQPQIIVNAAAYTAVDQAEKEEALAHAINAEAPGVMAEEAKKSAPCSFTSLPITSLTVQRPLPTRKKIGQIPSTYTD